MPCPATQMLQAADVCSVMPASMMPTDCRPPTLTRLFSGVAEAGYQRFRTTSQNFYDYDTKALAVGESNQGIVSEKSKWIHAKQTM